MNVPPRWMIYGANGYTGALVAREAAARGLRPILAGRHREPVEALATELGLEWKAFGLADAAGLAGALGGVTAVLHCAGPFVRTSRPMVDACLAAGCHYLDITGEIAVFEAVFGRAAEAMARGVALLPGVGFDVVPTDALAARVAEALPDATHLELAFASHRGAWSRGTLRTAVEALPHTGAERRDGRIVPLPLAAHVREVEFPGLGRRLVVSIPWGDVSTAFHTTGVANVRTHAAMSPAAVRRLRRLRLLVPLAGTGPVKRALKWWIGRTTSGPDAETRRAARTYLWAEARDQRGNAATATTDTPEGYTLTVDAALECVARTLAGRLEPGAWTPTRAFGRGLLEAVKGVAPVALTVTSAPGTRTPRTAGFSPGL